MKISARPLIDCCGVNDFVYATEVQASPDETIDFYMQLVDLEKNLKQHGYNPAGLRYVPATGATLNVSFLTLEDAKKFTRAASQPFATDPSIWKVSILPTDPLDTTVSLSCVLTETVSAVTSVKTFKLQAVINTGMTKDAW